MVAITGLGVASGENRTADQLWGALRRGETPPVKRHVATGVNVLPTPIDEADFSAADGRRLARSSRLALIAARQALRESRVQADPYRAAVVVATASAGAESWTDETRRYDADISSVQPFLACRATGSQRATAISAEFGWHGPSLSTGTACAAGNDAIGLGASLISAGTCDVVLVGGTDAPLADPGIRSMHSLGVVATDGIGRPFDVNRSGFLMAEGAGAMVLESEASARARSATIHGFVAGYAATSDGFHFVSPDPTGVHAERAITTALQNSGFSPADVSLYSAHASATKANDAVEVGIIRRLFPGAAVLATKGLTGHPFGATAVLEAILVLKALHAKTAPPPTGLVSPMPDVEYTGVSVEPQAFGPGVAVSAAFGLGGVNSAIILAGPDFAAPACR